MKHYLNLKEERLSVLELVYTCLHSLSDSVRLLNGVAITDYICLSQTIM
jgi:hypothetical protein